MNTDESATGMSTVVAPDRIMLGPAAPDAETCMYRPLLLLATLSLLLNACASDPTLSSKRESRRAQYNAVAGEPVDRIRAVNIYGWTDIDREQFVLWTRPKEAWLIDLYAPCVGLEFTAQIGISNFGHTIYAGTDSVVAWHDRCRIKTIRPVDYAQLQAEKRRMKYGGELEDRDERQPDAES